jgi:hypothetical protein
MWQTLCHIQKQIIRHNRLAAPPTQIHKQFTLLLKDWPQQIERLHEQAGHGQ